MFYNAAMALDRDLAVAFFRAWRPGGSGSLEGWDALAATGVRGLRLLHESEAFGRVVLTEAHPLAVFVLEENARRYSACGAEAYEHDARRPLARERFDVVDLDPFGTPAPFVEAGLRSLRAGGVLAVTATDMPVLAGVERGAAARRYGARPIRGRLAPEAGLRILLYHLSRSADLVGCSIDPKMCYVHDHHVRAYVEVRPRERGRAPVGTLSPPGFDGPRIPGQGEFGPMWLGRLFDPELIRRLRPPASPQDPTRLAWYIERFQDEVQADVPFFYEPNEIARQLHLASPGAPSSLVRELRSRGWAAGRTHARPAGVRTNAPRGVVESISRELALGGKPGGQSQNARVRA